MATNEYLEKGVARGRPNVATHNGNSPTGDAAARPRHVPSLDGLRGIAILLVILHHAEVMRFGWIGVDIFFVLSGYLITGILVHAKERPHYYRNFLARRALRILPPYYAYLLLVLVILPAVGYRIDRADSIWAWSYLTNFAVAYRGGWAAVAGNTQHLWSVAVEEQFYILWPAIVLGCSVAQLRRVCVWGIILALAFRVANVAWGSSALANYVLVTTRMDALLIGALLSLAGEGSALRHRFGTAWASLGSAILVVLLLHGRNAHDRLVQTIGYSLIAIFAGSLVVLCTTYRPIARAFSWRPLRVAGRFSYAAYLGHVFVLNLLPAKFGLWGWSRALLGILITFALAALSWYWFEAPILSLKRFFPSGDGNVVADGRALGKQEIPAGGVDG